LKKDEDFDIDEWLFEYDLEETRRDPHYSIYFSPEYEEEPEQ
jgi:hypothetical protein